MVLKFFWTCEDCADNLARLPYFSFLEGWYPSAKYERYPELEIKPAYIKKVKRVQKEKSIKVKSFADRYGLE